MSRIEFTKCAHGIELVEDCFLCSKWVEDNLEQYEKEKALSIAQEISIDADVDRLMLKENGYES